MLNVSKKSGGLSDHHFKIWWSGGKSGGLGPQDHR